MNGRTGTTLALGAVVVGLSAVGLAAAFGLAGGGANGPAEAATAEPAATITAMPESPVLPTPAVATATPDRLQAPRELPRLAEDDRGSPPTPGSKVEATPVRVFTGDGDCLNVRPQPGTTFEATPYSCVAEGTLLWLSGDEVEADGERWRYALGAGWVAIAYTRAAAPVSLELPGSVVTLWTLGEYRDPKQGSPIGGADVHVVRLDVASGKILARAVFPGYGGGLGARNPEISPDGEYVAFGRWDELGEGTTVVGSVSDGSAMEVPGYPEGWSAEGALLLVTNQSCDGHCRYDLAIYRPGSRAFTTLATKVEGTVAGWTYDGSGVFVTNGNLELLEISLDGRVKLHGTMAEDAGLWSAAPSPDGRYLLGAARLDSLALVSIDGADVRQLARAPQRELPGKCGGTWSRVSGWLDVATVFYHERSSADGQDGITLLDVGSGNRRVLPFFNAQDIGSPAPGMLSFASWSPTEAGPARSVTFVLDTGTGNYVPVAIGAGAVWR